MMELWATNASAQLARAREEPEHEHEPAHPGPDGALAVPVADVVPQPLDCVQLVPGHLQRRVLAAHAPREPSFTRLDGPNALLARPSTGSPKKENVTLDLSQARVQHVKYHA